MKKTGVAVIALLAVAVLSAVSFSSCKKTKNKVKFLIKEWTIERAVLGTKDIGVDLSAAFKGAKFNFKKDGTYTMSKGEGEGAGKLTALLPSSGKWSFDEENGEWVKFDGVKYTIQEEQDFTKLHLQGPGVYLLLK